MLSTPTATYPNGNRHPEDVLGKAYAKYIEPHYNLSGVEFTNVINSTDCRDLRNSINGVSGSFYDMRNNFQGLYSHMRLNVLPDYCGENDEVLNFVAGTHLPEGYEFCNVTEDKMAAKLREFNESVNIFKTR